MQANDTLPSYAVRPRRLRKGNRVTLLRNGGEVFPAMREAIGAAESFVHIEFYIWRGDMTGWSIADALIESARRGVTVRAMYDALGCIDVDPLIFETMEAEGIEVHQFRPLAPWRPRWGINRRNHRKIMVVDNRTAFVGGVNLADDYAARKDGGKGWRDSAVRIEGPAVSDLNRLFLNTWDRERGTSVPRSPVPPPVGDHLCEIVSNSDRGQRLRIRRGYLHAIKRARETIYLANAYFLPGLQVRRALAQAVDRGVDVRILLPGVSDIRAIGWASDHLVRGLLRRKVRLFRWHRSMMHEKAAVIDRTWATVGSYNLDYRSLRHNLEVTATVLDNGFGREMHSAFERDLALSEEVTLEAWRRRSRFERFRSWLFYQGRWLL